jgi:hypothetical protein
MISENKKSNELEYLVSRIQKSISRHKKSHLEIGYWDAESYVDELDQLREDIMFLADKHPDTAKKLMTDLIDIHENVFERADDSNGFIGDFFRTCVEDLGKIYAKLSVDVTEVVSVVYDLFMHNDYAIADEVIFDFKDVLKEEGLDLLKNELIKSAAPKKLDQVQKKAAEEYDAEDHYYSVKEHDLGKHVEWKTESFIRTIKRGLREIADCRNGVDEYIAACSFATAIHEHDHLGIAKRLTNHGRYEEALKWLDEMSKPVCHAWEEDYFRIKIDTLLLSGNKNAAQEERLNWFNPGLDYDLYEEIINNAEDDEFKREFRDKIIQKAFEYKNLYAGMEFLIKLKEIDKCAQLVYAKAETMIDGSNFYILRSAIKAMRDIEPLAAMILCRKLLENILHKGSSKYYKYAAKDLVDCYKLDQKITDFREYKKHEDYFVEIQEKHKKKYAFWKIYDPLFEKMIVENRS